MLGAIRAPPDFRRMEREGLPVRKAGQDERRSGKRPNRL